MSVIRFSGGALEYNEDGDDCPICHGQKLVTDVRWEAFFASYPKVTALMCAYFGIDDWRKLPHFNYACPDCFPAATPKPQDDDDEDEDELPF